MNKNNRKSIINKVLICSIIFVMFLMFSHFYRKKDNLDNIDYLGCPIKSRCKDSTVNEQNLSFKPIDYEFFLKKKQSKEETCFLIGTSDCKWCKKLKDIISNISDMNVLQVYYVELDNYDDNKRERFIDELEKLLVNKNEQSHWGIPLLIKIKNGTIVDYLCGLPVYKNVSEQLNDIWLKELVQIVIRKDIGK